jgi:transcriptional regulator with XRE-family HTH domain
MSSQLMLLRKRAGLSQREVGELLHVSSQTVSNWETGIRDFRLSPKDMLTLCKAYGCTLEELAGSL